MPAHLVIRCRCSLARVFVLLLVFLPMFTSCHPAEPAYQISVAATLTPIEPIDTLTPFLPLPPTETLTVTPTHTDTPEPSATPTPTPPPITITIVYNNVPFDTRLRTDWGFACLVQSGDFTLLFDTGGNGDILLSNLSTLGIDPAHIDHIALSHQHGDHINGLPALDRMNQHALVYMPVQFSEAFKAAYRAQNRLVEVSGWQEISPGIFLTGEIGGVTVEQALVIETEQGLLVITGCAHPGIDEIVQRAREHGEIYLVMGGFHLSEKSAYEVQGIISALMELGVKKVAPSHCTGTAAIELFRQAFGEGFIQTGAGAVVEP